MAIAKVLLVDDEVPFVDTMIKRLTKRNLEVLPAYAGEESLKKLAENKRVEVVVLDVKMPGMDGVETLKKIKQKYPRIEVIMLTGHATADSAVEGLKSGATDYLQKPTSIEDLIAKAEQAFARHQEIDEKIRLAEAFKQSHI